MAQPPIPDLVVAGHVCRDVISTSPGWRVGGSVFYAAATAARLGLTVGVLTAGGREVEALRDLPNTMVISRDARHSTSFENSYGPRGRRQELRALAPPVTPELLPSEWLKSPMVLMAPVAQEVPETLPRLFPKALIGLTPQGYLRSWAAGGEVRYQAWTRATEVLPHVSAVILSEEDLQGHWAQWLRHPDPLFVLTRAALGCELIHRDRRRTVAGFPAVEVDPTGAGDVFAAAFLLKLHEVREPFEAARFANCVASFSVQGPGIEALPGQTQVAERLARPVEPDAA
ncbi:MAG: PfkB family carbohydrate kinase [Chloroflexota bacterium]